MQTERVQKGWKTFHQHQNANRKYAPECKDDPENNTTIPTVYYQTLT